MEWYTCYCPDFDQSDCDVVLPPVEKSLRRGGLLVSVDHLALLRVPVCNALWFAAGFTAGLHRGRDFMKLHRANERTGDHGSVRNTMS